MKTAEIINVKPEEGVDVEGFFVGKARIHGPNGEYSAICLRSVERDILVPEVSRLQSVRFQRRFWFRIRFIEQVSIGKGKSIWKVAVQVGDPPIGQRGALRRRGMRLV